MVSWSTAVAANLTATWIDVGFGTAALGGKSFDIVNMALEEGFRRFDTAEAEWWYDQAEVGRALHHYFTTNHLSCHNEDLRVTTKIPPWSLTSEYDIRRHAANSRQELVGFCEHHHQVGNDVTLPFTLDTYLIHAPECWQGWHSRCDNLLPETHLLDLRSAWLALEAVVGHDQTVRRIGLSNVQPWQLRDIVEWTKQRQAEYEPAADDTPPPRLPDAVQAYADPLQPSAELRQICQEHDIEFVSYSTLGTQHRAPAGQNPVLTHPTILDLARQHQRSTAEVVLQWARQRGMSVIPRSTQRRHIAELARLLSPATSFELSELDLQRVDAMARR